MQLWRPTPAPDCVSRSPTAHLPPNGRFDTCGTHSESVKRRWPMSAPDEYSPKARGGRSSPSGEVGHVIEIAVDRDDAVAGDAAPFRSTAWNALAGSPWRLGWQGAGVSAIARHTGLDRKRVRKVIARGLEPPIYGPRQRRMPQLQ